MQGIGVVGLLVGALGLIQGAGPASPFVAYQRKSPGKSVPDCAVRFTPVRSELLDGAGIIVVHDNPEENRRIRACLKDGWDELPIRQSDGVMQVPTGELLLKPKPEADPSLIEALLKHVQLQIASPIREGRPFRASTEPLSAIKALAKMPELTASGLFEFVEPNWIVIRRPQDRRELAER